MGITGLNHITLVVSNLPRAAAFYRDVLGARVRHEAARAVYLEMGEIWLCLELGAPGVLLGDDSHIALSCRPEDYAGLEGRIAAAARIWKANRSEGASVYFCDPDGHKWELHLGDLASRLAHYRAQALGGDDEAGPQR